MRNHILGITAIFLVALVMMPAQASSHREAPLLAQDPMADNTDTYAFVSPDEPDKVTLIANFIPFQKPDGGPNFYSFDPNVVYEIHIDNNGDAVEDITYQWRFTTEVRNPATFLYNTGPVTTLDDPDLNVRQFYRLTRIDGPRRTGTATELSGRLPDAELFPWVFNLADVFLCVGVPAVLLYGLFAGTNAPPPEEQETGEPI